MFSERFCQDDLENCFGKQDAIGSRSGNATVHDFEYNGNKVKSQFSVRPFEGNIQGLSTKLN